MNKLTIIGNVVKTPELRTTQDGANVCSFTVAVNRQKTRTNQDPGADFFNVSAWREKGENCAKYLTKGSKVCVIGKVTLRTWETESKHGASMEVNAEDVEFLTRAAESKPAPSNPVDAQTGYTQVETDDLPF